MYVRCDYVPEMDEVIDTRMVFYPEGRRWEAIYMDATYTDPVGIGATKAEAVNDLFKKCNS